MIRHFLIFQVLYIFEKGYWYMDKMEVEISSKKNVVSDVRRDAEVRAGVVSSVTRMSS